MRQTASITTSRRASARSPQVPRPSCTLSCKPWSGGRPVAIVEHVDCVARDVGTQWKQPFGPADMSFRIEIEGDPSFTNFDTKPGRLISAMPVVNSVAAVCRAEPGLLGPLDVPRF
jgi:2,4-diaminopentanoate dehydrogenase